MIIRIVRMTFRESCLDAFESFFRDASSRIRAYPGCHHLELWKDLDAPGVRTTFSMWESDEALSRYRESDLFRSMWGHAKPLFSEPAVATSYEVVSSDPARSR